jgi:RHS repeat-associated protein
VGVLSGIEEDVPFDDGAAERLISVCDAAASMITGQAASRASWQATAAQEFRGHFADLFRDNQATAHADAAELASRLREVATGARRLREEARKEQQRREVARAWKREQEDRNLFEKGHDWLFGEESPPVGPAAEPVHVPVSAPHTGQRQTPSPGSGGGGGGGTSSARPEDLRTFASGSRGANDALRTRPATVRSAYGDFQARCRWGTLSADGVLSGFDRYLAANDEDVEWALTVAAAFERAGGSGAVSTLANSALVAALRAAGVDATRDDIVIDPPTAFGNPPTTGYADDPVNTSTGNFLENETDLAFAGATRHLVLGRTYNSFDTGAGAFGPGWSSMCEARLELTDDAARMVHPDGRFVVFPRLGGWDRATGASQWLTRTETGLRVSDNQGATWDHSPGGDLLSFASGPGTAVALHRKDGRLVRLEHERGRSIDLVWDDDRVIAARASDGREVTYAYDDAGRLVGATGQLGTRSYRWNDAGLVTAVVDADGVVEVDNAYDTSRRVSAQRSPFGRTTRYAYLAGRATVVSDADGTRSNTWLHDARGRLVGVVDADEHRQSMSYDAHGNAVMVTERDGSTTVHEYDERGRRTRTVTPSGADLSFGYDEHDRLTTVVAEAGAITEYAYPENDPETRHPAVIVDPEGGHTLLTWRDGLLTRVVDPVGVEVTFTHDEHGDLAATTDAAGNTARLERDHAGRVVAAITPSGARTTYTYDQTTGLLTSRRDADGATWRYEHTTAGRLAATIDPTGARTEVEHGQHGEESRHIDPLGRAVTRHHDELGNLASVELPDGSTWRFTHDALSRLTATTTPDGATWTQEHDETGAVVATTDPTGVRRTLAADRQLGTARAHDGLASTATRFDRLGRLVAAEQADGAESLVTYDRCGRPVEHVDATGALTTVRRDAAGRVVRITRPSGATTGYEYDPCGRLAAVIDPTGARTTNTYDVDGRLVAQTLPTGETAWTEYDVCGRVTARHQPGSGTARYAYDAAGRLKQSSDTWYGRRRFRYDAAGQLVEVVNGNGGVTRYTHDTHGRVTTITDPLGGVTRREYDAMNHVVAETDPLGRTTRAGYDAAGRQIWQEDAEGPRTEWAYDSAGRLASVTVDGRTVTAIERNLRARRVLIQDHVGDRPVLHELEWNPHGQLVRRSRNGRAVAWEYDVDGLRTAMTTPDGSRTSYAWDAAGRLRAVEHPLLGRASFERDASGRLVSATADGLLQTWEHRDGWVVAHTVSGASGFARTLIERDDEGRVVGVDRDGVSTSYGYDEARQLMEARTGGSVTRWSYDAAGRLVSESTDGATTEHAYDAAGQLVATTEPGGRRRTFAYDLLGRRTCCTDDRGRARELEWGRTGWLSAVTDRDGDSARRTALQVDALGELARVDDAEVFWDTAAPYATTAVQAGDQSIVAAGPVTGIGDTWITPGWRTARAGSDPWQVSPGSEVARGLTVGGAGELSVDGLEWLGARVYDPASRGFLSVDPLDPVPGAGWAGNPYSYAGNDPLHALDPLGLSPVTDAELRAYAGAHQGALHAAGDWMKDNWEYVAGGAMVVAGGVLMATGVGGPAGMMLVAAGADTIIQKATTGEVNWGEVALSGAVGAVGGGAAMWATRASRGGVAALRTTMAVNAGVNTLGAEAGYVIKNRENLTLQGALAAGAGGALSGAIGGAAGPAGGTIARQLGQKSTGLLAQGATFAGNFTGGFGGSVLADRVNGQPIDVGNALISGSVNGVGGAVASHVAPSGHGMSTLNSASYFGPRTLQGALNGAATNTQALYSQAATGTGLGLTFDLSKN